MDAIRQLSDNFSTTVAQPRKPTPPTRHTRATLQLPRLKHTYIPETRVERITKTVQFFPHNVAMPFMSSADAATDAASHLFDALAHPAPAAPFARFGS